MARFEKYTVIDIINQYKNLIENDMETYLNFLFTEEDIKEIANAIKTNTDKLGLSKDNEKYKQYKKEFEYKCAKACLTKDPELNTNEQIKLCILGQIYKDFFKEMDKKSQEKLKHLILGKKDYAILRFCDEDEKYNEDLDYFYIITKEEPEQIDKIKDKKRRDLFLGSIDKIATLEDFEKLINEKSEGRLLSAIIIKKVTRDFFMGEKKFSKNELKKIFEDECIDNCYDKEFEKAVKDYYKNNLQLLDKTKLLLNSAGRVILGIKLVKGEKIENVSLTAKSVGEKGKKQLKSTICFLRDIYEELKKGIYEDISYSIFAKDNKEILNISKKDIAQFLSRCTEDDYITDNEIEQIHKEILNGVIPQDLGKRRIANINVQDFIKLSEIYNQKTENEDKSKLLNCASELIKYLKDENLITNKKILNLYLNGEINLDFIKNTDMTEISPEEYNKKFKLIYDRMLYSLEQDNQEEQQKLNRYAELYQHLETQAKCDVDELILLLFSAYGEEYGEQIMGDLYELGVADFEKCIDWIGTPMLKELCLRGKLPPVKVREIYEEKKDISEEQKIEEIAQIINASPDITQRFMLIGSIFPENKKIRDELLKKCLQIEKENKEKSENNNGIERNRENIVKNYTKHIIDSFDRMNLMSLIDSQYYFKMALDGHALIYLPNFKELIVEKILNKHKESSYGAATYILSEDYFKRNGSKIIKNDKVNRKELVRGKECKDVEKIDHYVETWVRKIKEHFGIKEGSRWSDEELQKIENAIEKIVQNQNELGEKND